MNPAKPYDPIEFPFAFALATDNAPATIAKLRGRTFNKSDLPGGVLMNQSFILLRPWQGCPARLLCRACRPVRVLPARSRQRTLFMPRDVTWQTVTED